MAYATLAELKEYAGIDTSGVDDTLLTDLLDRAKGIIDRYTGRTFEAASDTTRYFDAMRDVKGRRLLLDEDLCAITTLTNGDAAVITSFDYVTEPRNRAPWFAITLKSGSSVLWTYTDDYENAISISGKWAYSVTPPTEIKGTCIRLAHYLYHQKDNAGELDRAVIAGNATILPVQIPADIKMVLEPYRKMYAWQ